MKKKRSFYITHTKVAQIPENQILDIIVRELRGRETFVDADPSNEERIYNADVFEQIMGELVEENKITGGTPPKKMMVQLEELAKATGKYHYVQVTMI